MEEALSYKEKQKLKCQQVSIIGNNSYSDIVAANLTGLGVGAINVIGKRNSSSPFVSNPKNLKKLFENLCPHLIYNLQGETDGDYIIRIEKDKIISGSTTISPLNNISAVLSVDEFRRNIVPSEFDFPEDTIEAKSSTFFNPKRVLMVGAGGIGNYCGIGLAEKGYEVIVMDFDLYENRNKNRQVFCDVGKNKAKVLCDKVKECFNLDWESLEEKFDENFSRRDFDIILGCVDNIETRIEMQKYSEKHEIPYIDGGVDTFSGQVLYKKGFIQNKKAKTESCALRPNPSIIIPNCLIGFQLANMAGYEGEPYEFVFDSFMRKRVGEKFYGHR